MSLLSVLVVALLALLICGAIIYAVRQAPMDPWFQQAAIFVTILIFIVVMVILLLRVVPGIDASL